MRILFVLPFVPYPPSNGGKMKVFNLLKYLSSRHQCDLICLGVVNPEIHEGLKTALPHIGSVQVVPYPTRISRCIGTLKEVLRLNPPSLARFASREFRDLLSAQRSSGRYDVIHYDIINMAQYHSESTSIASVHSPNDATSYVYFRLARATPEYFLKCKLYISAILLRRYERKIYGSFSKIHVVSNDDKRYLHNVAADLDIEVIPISSGYPYDFSVGHKVTARKTENTQGPVIVVCGNLGDAAIARGFLSFLQDVFPNILKEFPDMRLRVLGRRVAGNLLRRIKYFPNIEYFTWVESFETFITEADVVLVPDVAGAPGAKTRVVQAMALGRAVVGSEPAFEGVPTKHGRDSMIYRTPEECRVSLIDLLTDEPRRRMIGAAAAALAAEEYSLDRIGPKYEALYYAAKERHLRLVNREPDKDARHSLTAR
jgi:polysaccharide biosynthesis protein PslH